MYKWTQEDIQILKSNLHLTNKQLMLILPNKTISSIKYKCRILGIWKKSKFCKFSSDEILNLKNNKKFNDRITGHLLGDGSLNSDISFTLRNTHKDYVNELQVFFNQLTGRKNKISIIPSYIRYFNKVAVPCKESYASTFTCSSIFRSLKKKWYTDFGKIVPKDTILNPVVCNRWYCDDGNLHIQNNYPRITLYTDGFHSSDIDFLIHSLKNTINITSRKKIRNNRKTKQFVITISGKNVLIFLDYIGMYPVESFKYKWDI